MNSSCSPIKPIESFRGDICATLSGRRILKQSELIHLGLTYSPQFLELASRWLECFRECKPLKVSYLHDWDMFEYHGELYSIWNTSYQKLEILSLGRYPILSVLSISSDIGIRTCSTPLVHYSRVSRTSSPFTKMKKDERGVFLFESLSTAACWRRKKRDSRPTYPLCQMVPSAKLCHFLLCWEEPWRIYSTHRNMIVSKGLILES